MKKLLHFVPGWKEYHSKKVDTRLPGFEVASDLELARNTVCWLGDLARYKQNVWTEIRASLDSNKVSDIFLNVSVARICDLIQIIFVSTVCPRYLQFLIGEHN